MRTDRQTVPGSGSPGRWPADRKQNKKGATKDYRSFHFTAAEFAASMAFFTLLDAAVSYLFYRSAVSFFLLYPLCFLFLKERKKTILRQRKQEISTEFLDGIKSVSTSLQAGYAPENAFREALREVRKIYPEDSFVVTEFSRIVTKTALNYPLETLLLDLGRRSGVEEIRDFAEIFSVARRTGGDLILIVRNTSSGIEQRQETMMEIRTVLTGKQMEQKIMSIVPLAILGYVDLTSPDLIGKMYGNAPGITIMTVALVLYAAAFLWGRKIMSFEV